MHWEDQHVRRQFLTQFTNAELISIVQAMHLKLGKAYSVTETTVRDNFPWSDLLKFVCVISARPLMKKDVEFMDIFQCVDSIKRWVEKNEARTIKNGSPPPIATTALPPLFPKRTPPTRIPPFPRGLHIDHPTLGRVEVTEHAWERFCERFCQPYESIGAARQQLRGCFRSASPQTDVRPAMLVRRIISSNFQGARYLINEGLEARFILAADKNVLLTVEYADE